MLTVVSNSDSGSITRLKLEFQKTVYSKGSIYCTVQILKQLCKQYKNQIPTFVLNPVEEVTEELHTILQEQKGLAITQRKNVTIIHADKLRTFGKRYTLESAPDGAWICVSAIGSNRFHDLFIDISQSGNVLMSYRGLAKKTSTRETLIEVQLSVVPSSEFDCVYAYSYQTSCTGDLKRANSNALKKMELRVSRLSLSPEPYVKIHGRFHKITAKEFKRMFGVKLLKKLAVADKIHHTKDLKNINNSYRRLRPYLESANNLSYDEGIESGDLRYVSVKSLLVKILDQFGAGKCHLPRVAIVKVNDIVGNGLIAGEYIAAGTIIGEYSGELVKMDQVAADGGKVDNTYFAPYALDTVPGGEMFVIDAKKSGNPTRFINHSDINTNATFVPVFDGKKFRLVVMAVKPIEEGQQILLKYRSTYWSNSIPKPIPL